MVNLTRKIQAWIDDIPDGKLEGAFASGRQVYKNRLLRLDCQGVTSNEPLRFNFQVQVNRECPDTTLARLTPNTVAFCLAPVDNPWAPEKIKTALKESVMGAAIEHPAVEEVETKVEKVDAKVSKAAKKSKHRKYHTV